MSREMVVNASRFVTGLTTREEDKKVHDCLTVKFGGLFRWRHIRVVDGGLFATDGDGETPPHANRIQYSL